MSLENMAKNIKTINDFEKFCLCVTNMHKEAIFNNFSDNIIKMLNNLLLLINNPINYNNTDIKSNNNYDHICDKFKYLDTIITLTKNIKLQNKKEKFQSIYIYDEPDRICIDCGNSRDLHLEKKCHNSFIPCDLYSDDMHGFCKICTFSVSDHGYNILANLNTPYKTLLNLKKDACNEYLSYISEIVLYSQSGTNYYNLLILLAVYNFVTKKNIDVHNFNKNNDIVNYFIRFYYCAN